MLHRELALAGHAQGTPGISSEVDVNTWLDDITVVAIRQYKSLLMAGKLEVSNNNFDLKSW
jgi:hypothetical protein